VENRFSFNIGSVTVVLRVIVDKAIS